MGSGMLQSEDENRERSGLAAVPYRLPFEPLTVRIPVAVQLTGIGRSKIYELIKAGKLDTVKVGASTLITVASLRRLVQKPKR